MQINRIDLIMRDIYESRTVTTKELATRYKVSLDTIRRDLKILEDQGKVERVYGGATLPNTFNSALNYGSREIANVELKQEAAKKAVQEVKENDLVALNAGTTNVFVAQELCYLDIPITIITNNIAAMEVLANYEKIEVISVGGKIKWSEKSTFGDLCYESFRLFYPDISFLTLNAISLEHGISDFREFEIPIIKIIVKNSKRKILVIDSSKFNKNSRKSVLNFEDIDQLYTDNSLDKGIIKKYTRTGLIIK